MSGESLLVKNLLQIKSPMCIYVTSACNIKCQHCTADSLNIPDLNSGEFGFIIDACKKLKINTIRFTGGEPTILLPIINKFIQSAAKSLDNFYTELVTNAYFAISEKACRRTLEKLGPLKRVLLSYDKFHARSVQQSNLTNIIDYCKMNTISISGQCAISEPSDILKLYEYENVFGIPFNYQKVLPMKNGNIYYPYHCFEQEVLVKRCDQILSFTYMPSYGITHCCSSLFCKGSEKVRHSIADFKVLKFLKLPLYELSRKYTFGELLAQVNLNSDMLTADCSHPCELCSVIRPLLL
jgi:hypothetical protein